MSTTLLLLYLSSQSTLNASQVLSPHLVNFKIRRSSCKDSLLKCVEKIGKHSIMGICAFVSLRWSPKNACPSMMVTSGFGPRPYWSTWHVRIITRCETSSVMRGYKYQDIMGFRPWWAVDVQERSWELSKSLCCCCCIIGCYCWS